MQFRRDFLAEREKSNDFAPNLQRQWMGKFRHPEWPQKSAVQVDWRKQESTESQGRRLASRLHTGTLAEFTNTGLEVVHQAELERLGRQLQNRLVGGRDPGQLADCFSHVGIEFARE